MNYKRDEKIRRTDLDDNIILDLYINQKLSLRKIANKLNTGKETIRLRLSKLNIKRRDTSECCTLKQCGFPLGFHPKTEFYKGDERISGKNSFNYKGGFVDINTGYKIISNDNKQIAEHRYVWEQHFGKIPDGYVIHHINRDKLDNRIENLECLDRANHASIHQDELLEECEMKGLYALARPLKERKNIW
jgi:hypothetical protein